MELSMLQRVDEAFPWLPGEIREDCAVIWRLFESLSAKDVDSGVTLFHHDGEYRSAFAPAEGGSAYVGHAGLRKYFNTVFDLFDVWNVTPTNFIASDDRIMALCMFASSGRGSHITVEQPIGAIWILRDGLIRRGFGFLNVNDAVDSMAAQCGRERAEIESLVDKTERARAPLTRAGARLEYTWRRGDFTTGNRSAIAQYVLEKLKNYATDLGWLQV